MYTVYQEPNILILIEIAETHFNTRLAPPGGDVVSSQALFAQGIRPPGTQSGRSPLEMWYLLQLTGIVVAQHNLPPELQVYMTDRGYLSDVPETPQTLVVRGKAEALDGLKAALNELRD